MTWRAEALAALLLAAAVAAVILAPRHLLPPGGQAPRWVLFQLTETAELGQAYIVDDPPPGFGTIPLRANGMPLVLPGESPAGWWLAELDERGGRPQARRVLAVEDPGPLVGGEEITLVLRE